MNKKQGSASAQKPLRLQVFISRQGICSRRRAMEIIQEGKVKVNGRLVKEPSFAVLPGQDKVTVAGKQLVEKTYDYILLNKPVGYLTTKSDPFGGKTVMDLLPKGLRHLHPVGRLDKNSCGLLLLTNDGDLTYRLTHPKHKIERRYVVGIDGQLSPRDKQRLEKGLTIYGGYHCRAKISAVRRQACLRVPHRQACLCATHRQTCSRATLRHPAKGRCFQMSIWQGRKRQVRLMLEALGHKVVYLKRISHGCLKLGGLPAGHFRRIRVKEIEG